VTEPETELLNDAEPAGAWIGAWICWLCLLTAAGLYAAVALSPRLLTYVRLQQEYQQNQQRLVMLEQQVQRMDRIAAALESDPQFAADLARTDFETNHPGELKIPVPPELAINVRDTQPDVSLPDIPLPWFTPFLERLSKDRPLENALLTIAAALAIISFILSPGSRGPAGDQNNRHESNPRGGLLTTLRQRYRS